MADTKLDIVIGAKDEASAKIEKVSGSLSNLGSVAAKGAAAAAAAIAATAAAAGAFAISSIKDFSDVGDAVEKMAKRTGLSAEAVSGLRVAADMGGTSIEAVEAAAKKMQLTMTSASKASDGMKEAFKGIGMSINDIFAKGTTPDIKFELLGNAIANVKDPMERTQLAIEAFGKSGTDLLPMFEDGSFSMKEWTAEAEKLGVKFDDISAAKAAALNDSIGKMSTAWNGLKLKIGGELAPVVTEFIEGRLVPLGEKIISMIPTMEQMKGGMEKIRTSFSAAMNEFNARTGIITQLQQAFNEAWQIITEKLEPSIKKLIEASKPLWPLFEALGKLLAGAFIIALKIVIEALSFLLNLSLELIAKVTEWAAVLLDIAKPAMEGIAAAANLLSQAIGYVIDKFQAMKAAAVSAMNAAQSAISSIPVVGSLIGKPAGKAVGGPVTSGTPYIVGEKGPELFVPNQSGGIVPNNQLAAGDAGGGVSITLNIGNLWGANPNAAAREIGDIIIKQLQVNRRLPT